MANKPSSSSALTNRVVEKSATRLTPTSHQIEQNLKRINGKIVRNDDINNRFSIYHQNIRGLNGKINELLLSLPTEAPILICLTKHHLKDYELANTHIPKYKLGAKYCRKNLKQGGVCIYVSESTKFSNINLSKHTKEQDIELAAIQINIQKKGDCYLCLQST